MLTALNELNRSLHERGISILVACEKLSAFQEKLLQWVRRIKKGNLVNFSSLEETVTEDTSCIQALLKILLHIRNYYVLHVTTGSGTLSG